MLKQIPASGASRKAWIIVYIIAFAISTLLSLALYLLLLTESAWYLTVPVVMVTFWLSLFIGVPVAVGIYTSIFDGTILTLEVAQDNINMERTLLEGEILIRAVSENKKGPPDSMQTLIFDWLNEQPNRMKQRDMYLALLFEMGWPEGASIDQLIHCVVHSWGADGSSFGKVLVKNLNQNITIEDPASLDNTGKNIELLEAHASAIKYFNEYKEQILSLDVAKN